MLRGGDVHRLTDFGATLREHARRCGITELTPVRSDGQQLHGFLVTPGGRRPASGAADDPRRAVRAVRLDAVRRGPGLRRRRLRRRVRQPARLVGLRRGVRRVDHAATSASVQPRTCSRMLDDALARPELDETRVGVLGGSHGGFMTTWLVGHTDRFRAAVSERAVNALDSFTGSSDIGWGFADDLYGPDPSSSAGRAR